MAGHTATPFTYYPRLSASENHKGFFLVDGDDHRVGEIYPWDEDGVEGEVNADFIIRAVNCFEEFVAALEEWLNDHEECEIGHLVDVDEGCFYCGRILRTRAALAHAKEVQP